MKPEFDDTLVCLGIDPEDFAAYAKGCPSTYSFPSVALGMPDNFVKCQLRGNHTRHKAIYHGYPMEWD